MSLRSATATGEAHGRDARLRQRLHRRLLHAGLGGGGVIRRQDTLAHIKKTVHLFLEQFLSDFMWGDSDRLRLGAAY